MRHTRSVTYISLKCASSKKSKHRQNWTCTGMTQDVFVGRISAGPKVLQSIIKKMPWQTELIYKPAFSLWKKKNKNHKDLYQFYLLQPLGLQLLYAQTGLSSLCTTAFLLNWTTSIKMDLDFLAAFYLFFSYYFFHVISCHVINHSYDLISFLVSPMLWRFMQ